MTHDPPHDKHELREHLKRALREIPPQHRLDGARRAAERLRALREYADAESILAYAALPGELDLDPFILAAWDDTRRVGVPRVDWERTAMTPALIGNLDSHLETGRYGVRSPAPSRPELDADRITLAIIPGLGFDPSGGRLGRGAGFYDRWIAARRASRAPIAVVGVCFDEQILDRVPYEPHDQRVDTVVTPTRTIRRTHG